MRGQQHAPEDLAGAAQMVEIGAAIAGASRAKAFRVERRRVVGVAGVAQIDGALAGKGLGGAARARRQHAIEHVDAAQHGADQIGGFADAHQIARTVLRQGRDGRIEHRESRRLPLADRQPPDRIAVEADADQPCRGTQAQIGVDPALGDPEDAVPGAVDKGAPRAFRPAHRQFHRALDRLARRGRARAFVHRHGDVDTPVFMPVGTAGTVKAMTPEGVAATGARIVLGNTYHLMLRPGAERIAALGGLHRFMNWPYAILTDSGGFQVMSLAARRTIAEAGVTFRSHLDGSLHELTPERSIAIQHLLGADITMALDECTPYPAPREAVESSMELSMRWAERSRRAFVERPGHGIFGIVQGGVHPDLRLRSAARLIDIGFDGYAVGGLAIGEGQATTFAVLDATVPALPEDRPRYLMGVGKPADLVGAVLRGIDMFDCVLPTRSGRTAQAFTRRGTVNLRNARHADDPAPLDPECRCPACTGYSRAYLHHLSRAGEILGSMLLTAHNLQYYADLMAAMRAAIEAGSLAGLCRRFRERKDEPDPARAPLDTAAIAGRGGARDGAQPASRAPLCGPLHLPRIHLALPGDRSARFRPSRDRLRARSDDPREQVSEALSRRLSQPRRAFTRTAPWRSPARLVETLAPKWLRIGGYWYPRGGIPIDVFYQTGEPPAGLWLPDPGVAPYRGRG